MCRFRRLESESWKLNLRLSEVGRRDTWNFCHPEAAVPPRNSPVLARILSPRWGRFAPQHARIKVRVLPPRWVGFYRISRVSEVEKYRSAEAVSHRSPPELFSEYYRPKLAISYCRSRVSEIEYYYPLDEVFFLRGKFQSYSFPFGGQILSSWGDDFAWKLACAVARFRIISRLYHELIFCHAEEAVSVSKLARRSSNIIIPKKQFRTTACEYNIWSITTPMRRFFNISHVFQSSNIIIPRKVFFCIVAALMILRILPPQVGGFVSSLACFRDRILSPLGCNFVPRGQFQSYSTSIGG